MSLKDFISESICEPNTKYRYSPFPIKSNALAAVSFVSFFLVFAGISRIQPRLLTIAMPLGFGLALLAAYLYDRKPTVFEKTRHWLDAFTTTVSLYTRREFFGRLLIYIDGIEIRSLFKAYFIPYEHILKITRKKSPAGHEITILTDLESVPQVIKLQPKDSDSILASIQKAKKFNSAGHTIPTFKKPSAPPRKEPRRDAIAFEEEKVTYKKRVITYIILGEIALALLTGPIVMLFRYLTFQPTETTRLYSHNAYTPINPRTKSRIYSIIEVTYDQNGDVIRERTYDVSGIISTRYAHRNSSSGFHVSNIIFGLLTFAGVIIAAMGYQKGNEQDKIYGLTLFFTSFGMILLKQIIDFLLAFPFW